VHDDVLCMVYQIIELLLIRTILWVQPSAQYDGKEFERPQWAIGSAENRCCNRNAGHN